MNPVSPQIAQDAKPENPRRVSMATSLPFPDREPGALETRIICRPYLAHGSQAEVRPSPTLGPLGFRMLAGEAIKPNPLKAHNLRRASHSEMSWVAMHLERNSIGDMPLSLSALGSFSSQVAWSTRTT